VYGRRWDNGDTVGAGDYIVILFGMCIYQVRRKTMIQDRFYEELEQVFDHFPKVPYENSVRRFYGKTGERR
jgi:hypothetical protein